MRRQRTLYFNDARHYYLFVFEPPMRLEDAWVPIDEVAGTAVDTFVYGVSRGDGLFYPSQVGLRFGADMQPFTSSAYWRVWQNMQSLIDRGLDPLRVLIDRAHHKHMEFFASLRMGGFEGLDSKYTLAKGGRGYAHPEVRDHQFAVLEELASRYPVEGVELDFAAAPGGSAFWLRPEDVPEHTATMTQFVRRVAQLARRRGKQVGARVYPTEELNLKTGLEVRAWLGEGLVDYVVPMVYLYFILDANMPIAWLVQEAHERDIAIYPMLQPYRHDDSRPFYPRANASPAMMRAAAANFWRLGVDGLYTWFLHWPLGDGERRTLTELGDPDLVREGEKHYFLCRRPQEAEHLYPVPLPLELPGAATRRYPLQFAMADDPRGVGAVRLRLGISNLVSADRLEVRLNDQSLEGERCGRAPLRQVDPYAGQWLEFHLEKIRPRQGENLLEIALLERPAGLAGGIAVEEVEILVDYGIYSAGLAC